MYMYMYMYMYIYIYIYFFFIFFFRQYFIGFGTSTITYVNHLRMIWLVVLVRSH